MVRQEQGTAVAQAGHRRRPGGAHPVHGTAPQGARLAQRDQRHPGGQQEEPATRPAQRSVRSRPQVHRAVHDRHGRPGLQQGRHRSADHQDRRPVGSGLQGQGQPALRHAGRAGDDHVRRRATPPRTRPSRACRKRSTWSRSRRTRARSAASPATTTPTTWRPAISLSPRRIPATSCSCRPTTRIWTSSSPSPAATGSSTPR